MPDPTLAPEPIGHHAQDYDRLVTDVRALADEFHGYGNDYVASRIREHVDRIPQPRKAAEA